MHKLILLCTLMCTVMGGGAVIAWQYEQYLLALLIAGMAITFSLMNASWRSVHQRTAANFYAPDND